MNDDNPYQPPQSELPAPLKEGRPDVGTAKWLGLRRPFVHWLVGVLYCLSLVPNTVAVIDVLKLEGPPAHALLQWLRTLLPLLALVFFRHDRRAYYFISVMQVVDIIEIVYHLPELLPFGEPEPPFPGLILLFIIAIGVLQCFVTARFILGRPSRAYYDLAYSNKDPRI